MYIKILQGCPLYEKLRDIFVSEKLRYTHFSVWQHDHLPDFGKDVLIQRSPWYIYPLTVAWCFKGTFDSKAWREVKGYPGYYVPKTNTIAGRKIRLEINQAQGERFNRLDFFDVLGLTIPHGSQFVVPAGFYFEHAVFMVLDDSSYQEISKQFSPWLKEITTEEYLNTKKVYINSQNNESNE